MLSIALACRKGGVGKTTVTAGLACLLAAQGLKVLAVDLDPQSNLAFVLGGDPSAPGSADLLDRDQPNPEPQVINDHLHVLAGGPELERIAHSQVDPEDLADEILVYEGYDVRLFDCPPSHESLERLGLVAADKVLIAVNPHPLAVTGMHRVLAAIQYRMDKGRRGAREWAIVASLIDKRRVLDRNLKALVGDVGDTRIFQIRQDSNLSNAGAQRTPITEYAPDCRGVEDMAEVVRWCHGA